MGAAASTIVRSFAQSAVSVDAGGTLTVQPGASRLTNIAARVTLTGSGTLDLNNHELLTYTAPATIKAYLRSAYDPNGNQDWGQPGLTSSLAKVNPTSFSLGYAFGGDPSAQDAGVTTKGGAPLDPSQTIVRALLTGDANLDGNVNFFDLTQILGYRYNAGGNNSSYTDGDLDYNGEVNFFDIVTLLSANYNSGQKYLGAEPASSVPEPIAMSLIGLGAAGLLARRRQFSDLRRVTQRSPAAVTVGGREINRLQLASWRRSTARSIRAGRSATI